MNGESTHPCTGLPLTGTRLAEICWDYLAGVGLQNNIWFAGGYDLGIGIPPDWVGHYWWGAPGYATLVYQPGAVSNYENVFDIGDESWGGGSCASYIETLLMTESGLDILSQFPRTLTVV